MLSALSNQGIGLPVRNRKVFTSDVVIRAKANANKVTLKHDGTNGYAESSSGGLFLKAGGTHVLKAESGVPGVTIYGRLSHSETNGNTYFFGDPNSYYTLGSAVGFKWSSTALASTADVGIGRNSAGMLEVNSGTAGTYRDMTIRDMVARTLYPTANATTDVPLVIAAVSSQTADMTQWKALAGGTVVSRVASAGNFIIGGQLASIVPLTVNGVSAQSANLTEWKNVSSVVLASIGSDGAIKTFDSTGLKYLALSHNGTLGNINNPTGDIVLSSSNIDIVRVRSATATGITLPSHAFLAFSSTTSPNGSYDTLIGRYGAGIALVGTALGNLAFGWDGTDGKIAPSAGNINVDFATGSVLKIRRTDITARFVTINPDSGGAGTQINSWGKLELEATNGSSHIMLRGSRVVFNDAANTAPVSVIGTTDLLTVYNGGGTAIRDLKARTLFGVAQAATDIPLNVTLAAAQSANAFNITSNGGTAGDIFNITSTGDINLPSGTQIIQWGATGTGLRLSLTTGTNPQLNIKNFDNTIYGRVRAHTYYFWDGSFIYTDGTAFSTYKSNGSTYSSLYTGNQRIYDTAANTAYLALSHDGTNASITTSAGDIKLNSVARVRAATARGITLDNTGFFAWSSTTSPDGSYDTLIGRSAAGIAIAGTALGNLAFGWDGTDGKIAPSAGNINVDFATGSVLKLRRTDITTRFVTINPDFGGAGTQINSWGRLDLEAQNGSSALYLRAGRVVFNDVANSSPVSLIGTTDLLTVYNGAGSAIKDLKARTLFGVAQAATDIPLSITLAAAQSANAFNITSNGGTAGDIFNITSTGDINLPSNTQVIRWGTSGQGMYLKLTYGSNPQLDIRDYTNSYYARVRADTYYFNNGEYLYSDTTKMRLCKSSGYYHNLWTAAHRVYDSTAATYLSLDATASYGDINTSSGYLVLRAAGSGSYAQISSSAMYWVAAGTAMIGFMASNASAKSDYGIGWSSGAVGTNDVQLNRRASGTLEINSGTSGALRDLYARTVYGIAQAATDIPLVIQGAASQSANLTQWKNSSGTTLSYVASDANFNINGMTVGGYSIRSTTSTALYLIGSSSGVEIGNYGTALATVKPNSANGTTSLQYFLTSNTAISEASAGVAEVNNGTAGTLRDLSARNVYSNGNPVGTGKDIYNMIW